MIKIIFYHLRKVSFHLSAILILFIVLITLFENKNMMILTMSSNSSHPLHANFYYTKSGFPFNDNKVSHADKISDNQYYFTLPDLKEIQYARLDPARQKREISIQKDIQIIRSKWFRTSVYTADITKSEVGNQIKNYKIEENGIRFTTTGNDPQLNLNLARTFQSSNYTLHLDILFKIIIIYLFFLFLFKLYTTKEPTNFLPAKYLSYVMSPKYHTFIIIVFLVAMGSHFLDYYPLIFIIISIFLINWRKFKNTETILLSIFLGSVCITWFFLDPSIIFNYRLLGQGLLIFSAYLLASSLQIYTLKENIYSKKTIFYLFFGFFIAYTMTLLYSYMTLPSADALNREGMYVCFQNEYKRLHVNNGNLISTILAYYLTFTAILLPFILFYFKKLRAIKFSYIELALLLGLALFSLYLSAEMGRRTVFVLVLLAFLYLAAIFLLQNIKTKNYYHILFIVATLLIVVFVGYYFFADTMAVKRLASSNITHDRRFQFWIPGLQVMLEYPFGGGHDIYVGHDMKLAHNTWIDIGKDFGIIPFVSAVFFFLIHLFHLLYIVLNRTVDSLIKHMFVVFFISFFAILMIEPVFTSDKTFFFYIIFYLGLLKNYATLLQANEKEKSI